MVLRLKVRSHCPVQESVALCLSVIILVAGGTFLMAANVDPVPRVLILYPYDERLPATTIAGETARARLLQARAGKIDLFSEFLDLSRFPEEVHIDRMATYLADKYTDHRPDVVIALGEEATRFIVNHRKAIAPDAKIVFAGFSSDSASQMSLPTDVVGAFSEFDISRTLELARNLQPNARHLIIIAGKASFDHSWIASAREDLAVSAADYETTYLEGLAIDELVERATHFPADSIVLFLTMFADGNGRNFLPKDALDLIAAKASAPIYGPYDTYVGHGVVGGNTVAFESMGTTVANLALDALAGNPLSNIDVPSTFFADARQLKRWGLPATALPTGAVLSFQEKTLWQEYWEAVTATLVVLALQGLVIAGLLFERRRRRQAELEARHRLLEVVHLNQSATAGALSASIAHELNQPLGAIRINAEAAEMMLQSDRPNNILIRQILADIREDDQRASDIIVRLRGLLKKRSEIDWQEFDLNEVIRSALQILHAEAARRNVLLSSNQFAKELPVRADQVHVQQVLLNLATNAMDAMLDAVSTERKLVFQTALTEGRKVEVSISDTGRGIPEDQLGSVFDAFYTTKPSGTGLGLSIARTIVETYGGKIWADNRPEGGAVFRFVLPLAQRG